jgi:hypothetical protein
VPVTDKSGAKRPLPRPKVVLPILFAVMLAPVIATVAVVAAHHGSGSPANQAQDCSKVAHPVLLDASRTSYVTANSQLNRSVRTLSALCPSSGGTSSPHPTGSGLPPASGSGRLPTPHGTGEAPQCAGVQAIIGTGISSVPAPVASPNAPQPTGSASESRQVAKYFGQRAERFRQAGQALSWDPPLAKDLNAIATDMQEISTTSASGGNALAEAGQLEHDLNTLNTLCPSLDLSS